MSDDNGRKSGAVDDARDGSSDVNDHSQSTQPPPNNQAIDDKNNETLSQLQNNNDTVVVATDSNDAAAAIDVDINVNDKQKDSPSDEDNERNNNMLPLISKIIRSAIERSRYAEDLIREGMMIDDDESDNIATNDVQTASLAAKQSSIITTTSATANETTLLRLPSSWKRSNYASKTISEIENYIAKANNTKDTPERNLTNVEYNECSLLALANWAVMDNNSPNTSAQNGTDDDETNNNKNKSSPSTTHHYWEQYKREQEKLRATSTTKYDMPVPPKNAFRRCGVCGCFGHYEIECDLLVSFDEGGNDQENGSSSNEVMLIDNGGDGKVNNTNKERKRKRLDENSQHTIVSKLAKEVRIQRTLHTLLSGAKCKEVEQMKARGKSSDDDGDSSYWVTSQRCNVCLSALGDESMLVCDGCDELYHMQCLDPPLTSIPEGDWFCDSCQANDFDISSTVDIEGCGGFVIEQRKRSLAEEERYRRKEDDYVGVSIGEDNPWVAAMSILVQKEPDVVNISSFKDLYMRARDDEGSRSTEFALNEVVWAKRQFGRIKYWPAIVSKVDERGFEVKYLPLGDVNLDRPHHKSQLLPFFPYFEDLGYDRLMTNDLFRRALEVSVIKTGLKTLGQALNFARCGTQLSFQSGTNEVRNADAARALKGAGWVAPAGWENAEIDEIDGIMIVARDDDGNFNTSQPSLFSDKSVATSEDSGTENDDDECEICHKQGDLLICDGGGKGGGCNKVFHVECINRDEIPPGMSAVFRSCCNIDVSISLTFHIVHFYR